MLIVVTKPFKTVYAKNVSMMNVMEKTMGRGAIFKMKIDKQVINWMIAHRGGMGNRIDAFDIRNFIDEKGYLWIEYKKEHLDEKQLELTLNEFKKLNLIERIKFLEEVGG